MHMRDLGLEFSWRFFVLGVTYSPRSKRLRLHILPFVAIYFEKIDFGVADWGSHT